MQEIVYTPIGIVYTSFATSAGMPIQTVAAQGTTGRIELDPAYAAGLKDIEDFSHLWLLTHLHQNNGYSLEVTPYLDTQPHGVFATRSPRRPNPLGLSLVRLNRVEGAVLHIEEVDLLDGTPLLDIKPYVGPFDQRTDTRMGWFTTQIHKVHEIKGDNRWNQQTNEKRA